MIKAAFVPAIATASREMLNSALNMETMEVTMPMSAAMRATTIPKRGSECAFSPPTGLAGLLGGATS